MFQIAYISTAVPDLIPDGCSEILATACRNNAVHGITGLLLFNGRRFLQVIEGEQLSVETLFSRIVSDSRHRGVLRLLARRISEREFGDWAMEFIDTSDDEGVLLARADRLDRAAQEDLRVKIRGYREFMPV